MLILARAPGERTDVLLPDGRTISVFVHSVRPDGKVRLGFEAPKDIAVVREEAKLKTRKPLKNQTPFPFMENQ